MVSLVKVTGRHRSEHFTEALHVTWVTCDGCVMRLTATPDGKGVREHIGGCRTDFDAWNWGPSVLTVTA